MVGHKLQCGKPQSLTWHTRAECNSAQQRAQALTGALIKSCSGRETRIEQRTEEAEIRGNIDVSRLARFRIYRSDRTLLCSRVGDCVATETSRVQSCFSQLYLLHRLYPPHLQFKLSLLRLLISHLQRAGEVSCSYMNYLCNVVSQSIILFYS